MRFESSLGHLEAHPHTPPQGQAGPHTTILTTDSPIRVEVINAGRDPNPIYDLVRSGVWARLSAGERCVLFALYFHARDDGLVVATTVQIAETAGLGRSATYEAIKGLMANPAGLLARQGRALIFMPGARPA